MLEALRNFNADKHLLDDLIALQAFGDQLSKTYPAFELETPEWLKESMGSLAKEIRNRTRELLEKELADTESRIEALKTNAEKRDDLSAKRQRLRERLNK